MMTTVSMAKALAARSATQIFCVANQKGGVGKTTLGFHLVMAAADAGKRVLVLDCDTQGNLSQVLTGDYLINRKTEGGASYLFSGPSIPPDAFTATQYPNVSLLHGHGSLEMFDNNDEVVSRVASPDFRAMLRQLGFDVIIVDTPPAVGIRQLAPLIWADKVIIPMEPVNSAVIGFQAVLDSIETVRSFNPGLKWVGVLNRLNRQATSHRAMEKYLIESYGSQMGQTLSARTAIADAMQQEIPVPVWRLSGARRDVKDLWLNFCSEQIG